MGRKPAENYYQLAGRRHVGLSNPEKFGLTYEQVVRIVDEGKWRSFYSAWHRTQKALRKIKHLNYVCPTCKERIEDTILWLKSGKCCLECEKERLEVEGSKYGKIGKRGKSFDDDRMRFYCSVCKQQKQNVIQVGSVAICKGCWKKV